MCLALKLFINPLAAILTGALCRHFGCRRVVIVAGAIASLSLFGASFATKIWHLYIFYGVAGKENPIESLMNLFMY